MAKEVLKDQTIKHVDKNEQLAFYFGALFRDMSYAIMGYLTYFYIDIMGLSGVALSIIMIGGRLWDGINDPIMGVYFDKHVSDKEKAMPFLRKTTLPVAILIIAIFYSPTFSPDPEVNMWLRTAYALATYIMFEWLHTLNGISFMSFYNSITPNVQERGKIISVSRLFSNVGTGIISGIIPIALSFFANDNVLAKTYIYFGTAVFVAICFLIYNSLLIKHVKERVILPPEEPQSVKAMFKDFFKNRLLLTIICANAISGLINAGNTSLWFYTYNLGNPALLTYIGLTAVPMLVINSFLAPYLMKKFDKSTLVIASSTATILFTIIYLIVGYQNLWFVCLINMLLFFPMLFRGILYWSMISDSIDYLEWRTGERNDGMVLAIEGITGKIIGSIGALSTVIIVSVIKYVPNAPTQSEYTLKGLFYLPNIITIISTAVSTIPYFFYHFSRKDHERVLRELKARKSRGSLDIWSSNTV
jgi:sugar (glycoside-pentoside-hexuronide) transporter